MFKRYKITGTCFTEKGRNSFGNFFTKTDCKTEIGIFEIVYAHDELISMIIDFIKNNSDDILKLFNKNFSKNEILNIKGNIEYDTYDIHYNRNNKGCIVFYTSILDKERGLKIKWKLLKE